MYFKDKSQQLFHSFQKGEEMGFAYFFKLNYRSLLSFAITIVYEEPAAEDIVEETFIKLWQKRESVQSAASVKSYLYTIVKNACFDFIKGKKKDLSVAVEASRFYEIEENPLAAETISLNSSEKLNKAVTKLPKQKEKIIQMFYLEEKPIKQIADELNLSANTVRNQKVRALEILRKNLKDNLNQL